MSTPAHNIRIIIGKKLRHWRETRGMSQKRLADLANMSQPEIARFETGERKISVDHAIKLAPLLGIRPVDLLPQQVMNGPQREIETDKGPQS